MEERKPKNVFTNRNFVLAFLGAFVSNTGAILYSFAVSFYILSLTDNDSFIQGLYLAVGGLVFALVVLFGGVISDRFHKGKIMYICDYAKGGLLVLMTILLMTIIQDNTMKVVVLFIVAVIGNFISAIFSPAASSLLPHIVPEESFQQAQSYYSIMNSFQAILGLILAGILYTAIPINILFLIVGGCYILSGISEMFIKYDYQKTEAKLTVKAAFNDIGSAFKYLITLKPILFLVIAILFVNFFFTPLTSNMLPYFIATDVMNNDYLFHEFLEPEMWSVILSIVLSIGSIIFAVILSMKPKKEHIAKDLRIAFILMSLAITMMAVPYILFEKGIITLNVLLIIFIVAVFAIGAVIVHINIPTTTTIMTIVDKEKLGKVNSLLDVGSQGLIPLANFIGGVIISSFGLSALMIFCAAGFILTTSFICSNKYIGQI